MNRLRDYSLQIIHALWFIPALVTSGFGALALGMIWIDVGLNDRLGEGNGLDERFPLVFGAGAEGARAMLATVAGALITAAGVTFSGVLVALSIASSQYTSRILSIFTSNRLHQLTLGAILGGFVYALVVLKSIGSGAEPFVPELATLAALPIGLFGVSCLVLFVHGVSQSIRASEILADICVQTEESLGALFSSPGETPAPAVPADEETPATGTWSSVHAPSSGYLRTVDKAALVAAASSIDAVLRTELMVGDYVIDGVPLASFTMAREVESAQLEAFERAVCDAHVIGTFRTVEQDAAFGIRQMVDIALRALSPGVNDTTTAVMAIHRITTVLHAAASGELASEHHFCEGTLRLIAPAHDLESLVRLGFEQITSCSQGNVAATHELIRSWVLIARAEATRGRSDIARTLASSAERLLEHRPETDHALASWDKVEAEAKRLRALAGD